MTVDSWSHANQKYNEIVFLKCLPKGSGNYQLKILCPIKYPSKMNRIEGQMWCLMTSILATWKAVIRTSWFEASPGKKN
jgi:hypothetical protein